MGEPSIRMKRQTKIIIAALGLGLITALLVWYLQDKTVAVFESRGVIANEQRKLIIFTLLLSLVVVIPVFGLLIMILVKYREGRGGHYDPTWDHNRLAETIWWVVPLAIIGVLGWVTWHSTHQLDPYRPIASDVQPVRVQVMALDWKWLFIYPDERIATVNYLQIPVDTPINFEISSAGAMNSFWVPQLAGQVYAMSGMSAKLHVMADTPGDYRGVSANLSGEGFAGMHFTVKAVDKDQYYTWTQAAKQSDKQLTAARYQQLVKPSEDDPEATFGWTEQNMYDKAVLASSGGIPAHGGSHKRHGENE